MREEFYAGLEDRKYLALGDAQKNRLKVGRGWEGGAGSRGRGVSQQPRRATGRGTPPTPPTRRPPPRPGGLVGARERAVQAGAAGHAGVGRLPH